MIKFGPSGNSEAFFAAGKSKSEESALWVKDMGLDCFEYSFGRGVNITDEKALKIGKAFFDAGVEISVHAPYFVNLANPDDEMAEKSYNYILESAKKCLLMGGNRVVFHPASQGKMKREQAVSLTVERLKALKTKIYENGLNGVKFCPETMGKQGQIGTVEEITEFCKVDEVFTPCVDFGHVNARECGSLKTERDFIDRLEYMINELGYSRMQDFHVHFSKIEYSAKGEIRHLTFRDDKFGPDYETFIYAIKKLNLYPYIVSESAGTQDVDALAMKNFYFDNKK